MVVAGCLAVSWATVRVCYWLLENQHLLVCLCDWQALDSGIVSSGSAAVASLDLGHYYR